MHAKQKAQQQRTKRRERRERIMSNPWKKNILDRSLDDLATDNQKYKKSAQYKKDVKQAEVAEKKRAAAERKAKADADREERIATQTAVAESSVNGSIDLTQFFDEEKVKALLAKFGTVEKCTLRFKANTAISGQVRGQRKRGQMHRRGRLSFERW